MGRDRDNIRMKATQAKINKFIKQYKFDEPINVTKTHLPNLESFQDYLNSIWENNWVTNNGPLHLRLEMELVKYLKAEYINLFCNGTLALMLAMHASRLNGEIITTPFTFPATPNVLHWNEMTPVFCDIEPHTYNIDTEKVESLITPKTSAILAVHVFGNPCNVQALEYISNRHGVKIIYDAAHAFGVELNGKSIANFGDISAFSFHATKLFHTIEGGALAVRDLNLKKRIDYLKNFGIADEETVITPGINAKMNEFQAAIGLLELNYVDTEIQKREKIHHRYIELLKMIPGIKLPEISSNVKSNYAYFPILIDRVEAGMSRDELYDSLRNFNVFPRKYFYPLCSNFPFFASLPSAAKEKLPIANKVAENILCLPMYGDLELDKVGIICHIIKNLLCV